MGTLLHVRTAAAHEFLRACPILQLDYWLWITLSCSNALFLSAISSFDLCSLTFPFIFLLCLSSCVKIGTVFSWLLTWAISSLWFLNKSDFILLLNYALSVSLDIHYIAVGKHAVYLGNFKLCLPAAVLS